MAGYREIPVEDISTLQDLSGSIVIPWDRYNLQDGNLYLTPDLEAEDMPTFTIDTDYNPHDYSRSLNLKFKPVLTNPHLGTISMPQIRIIQSASRLEYRLELFNLDDVPEGDNLSSATILWGENSGTGSVNSNKSAGGGQFLMAAAYYCEYTNYVRTKAIAVNLDTSLIEVGDSWISLSKDSENMGIFAINAQSRGNIEGDERQTQVKITYNPLEDPTFNWSDESSDPYPEVDLSFNISQEGNYIINYIVDTWEVQKHSENYWPPYYLPNIKGDDENNYLDIKLEYQEIYTSGSINHLERLNNPNIIITQSPTLVLQLDKVNNLAYLLETSSSEATSYYFEVTLKSSHMLESVNPGRITLTQAPKDNLVKASQGEDITIMVLGEEDFESSAYPKN